MTTPIDRGVGHNQGCGTPSRCHPIWPSNTSNELLYSMQRLFSRDNHNHDQVLGERTYNLPLLIPQNQLPPATPFAYVQGATRAGGTAGQVVIAPYSTDNIMHTSWVPYRLGTNLNTPIGSDSDIYFDKVKPAGEYKKWQDWLDTNQTANNSKSLDHRIGDTCSKSQNSMVCSQTCVDWFTNRIVNPQGSMASDSGMGGGCPFGTLRSLTCYPCKVHNTYMNGAMQ